MKYRIIWTDKAISDLRQIFVFLHAKSESAAYKTVEKIHDRIGILTTGFTKTGQREPLLLKYKEEYRYLLSGNYKIIYYPADQNIYISTIFDVRQNPKKLKVIK